MDVIDQKSLEREAVLLQANREELVERIGRAMRQDGTAQPLQGCTYTATPSLWSRCTAWSSHRCAWLPRAARSSCWARTATDMTPSTICS